MRASIWMLLATMLLVTVNVAPALASDKEDAMVPVRRFIDSMNKNDARGATAAYAPQASITDEFPPYHWIGNSAFADWVRDFEIDATKNEVTNPRVTLQNPRHVDVVGDRAYIVVPAALSFKQHGKPKTEKGAVMTFALQKYPDGWLIAGWTWTKH
ncbi:MAG TPA: nuclear transport factor 2 family protein [Candidatus Limnocylindrales bacterium]|nr:nuclear transport factor 2 family protein [Candidatus Limnocylindrales bacterium]